MGPFKIRLGIPEMLAYWQELRQGAARGTLNKEDLQLYKKWGRAMVHLAADPFYPGLKTHEIPPLSRRYGMKVWQSYLENKNSRAPVSTGSMDRIKKILPSSGWSRIRKIKNPMDTRKSFYQNFLNSKHSVHCKVCHAVHFIL